MTMTIMTSIPGASKKEVVFAVFFDAFSDVEIDQSGGWRGGT